MSDRLLTIQETAEILKVHWQTVRTYIRQGKLRASKIGRTIRLKESDVISLHKKPLSGEKHEIEIRFLLKSARKIENNLSKLGAKEVNHNHMIVHWYVPNSIKNIEQKNKWFDSAKGYGLRIIELDNGYTGKVSTSLEVKRLFIPNHHDTCIEHEIIINNFEEGDKLLRLMNYKRILTVDKDRKVYKYSEFIVSIDDIKDYKVGIEVEKNTHEDRKVILPKLIKAAKEIGLDVRKELLNTGPTFLLMQEKARF